MGEPNRPSSSKDPKKEKERLSETMERLKKSEKIGEWSDYAKANPLDTISYIVLIVGVIILFFDKWIGGALLGILFGVYYSREMIDFFSDIRSFVEKEGVARTLILAGVLVGALILNVAFFIAAAVGVGLKRLYHSLKKK